MTSREHNELVKELITRLGRSAKTYAQLLTLHESLTTGVLLLLETQYKINPAVASELVASTYDQALERFVKVKKR